MTEVVDLLLSNVNHVPVLFCKLSYQFVPPSLWPPPEGDKKWQPSPKGDNPYVLRWRRWRETSEVEELEVVGIAPRAIRHGAFAKRALHSPPAP